MNKYPDYILSMLSADGFLAQYYQHRNLKETDKEAYEFTEALYERYYGKRKYSDYWSFVAVKNRKLRG